MVITFLNKKQHLTNPSPLRPKHSWDYHKPLQSTGNVLIESSLSRNTHNRNNWKFNTITTGVPSIIHAQARPGAFNIREEHRDEKNNNRFSLHLQGVRYLSKIGTKYSQHSRLKYILTTSETYPVGHTAFTFQNHVKHAWNTCIRCSKSYINDFQGIFWLP